VLQGYGKATLGLISQLLQTLETLEDKYLRFSRNSTFVDIESRYQSCVLHTAVLSGEEE
jgi:hypothetical protein